MKIAMYDLEGHLLEVFEIETVVDLEKQLNIPQGSLNNCINGSILSTINRQFREIKGSKRIINRIGDISNYSASHLKPIHKYYNDKYICTYESSKQASSKNNIDDSAINKCCNGINKTAGGFEWKYAS